MAEKSRESDCSRGGILGDESLSLKAGIPTIIDASINDDDDDNSNNKIASLPSLG